MRWFLCRQVLGTLAAGGAVDVSAAAREIPLTGDASKFLLPAMGVLLVVSAILLVVYLVLSKKKK